MDGGHSQVILVITWFLAVTLTLAYGARGITKAILVRSIGIDDYLVTLSFVSSFAEPHHDMTDRRQLLAIGQSVAVSVEAVDAYKQPPDLPQSSTKVVALKVGLV